MPEVIRSPQVYDAVIVGSGAGGGMAAYVLTKAGAKCLMLEAGDWWDTAKQSTMFKWPYEAPIEAPPRLRSPMATLIPAMAAGISLASPIPVLPAAIGGGGEHARWEAAPIIGEESHCAWGLTISNLIAAMGRDSTGPSLTRTWRLITIKPRN